jgi:hypothetical protein
LKEIFASLEYLPVLCRSDRSILKTTLPVDQPSHKGRPFAFEATWGAVTAKRHWAIGGTAIPRIAGNWSCRSTAYIEAGWNRAMWGDLSARKSDLAATLFDQSCMVMQCY